MTKLHLTDDQLAALADGAVPAAERTLLEEHLRCCRACYDAYSDALRYRAIWTVDSSIFRAGAAAATIAHETPLRAQGAHSSRRPSITRAGGNRWRFLLPAPGPSLAGAALLVALVLAVWQPLRRGPAVGEEVWTPVREAVEEASAGGSIVIPGSEAAAGAAMPAFRSGRVDPSGAVQRALTELSRAYRDRRTSRDVAQWLVSGYLAVGQLENARVYAGDARRRYPDDTRFAVLEAIVAYRSNEMPRAERLLQQALRTDPQNGAALLNLGLVQYEQGRIASARRTLESARARFAGLPLGERADVLLTQLLGAEGAM